MSTQATAEKNGTTTLKTTEPQTDEALAGAEKPIIAEVTKSIMAYVERGTLHLPANYSVENALKSAWLYLTQAVDKDKRPLLKVCTRASVVNALMQYAIQGLNTDKKQAYFIAYGQVCTMQRSYFGDQAVAMRVKPGINFYYQVIHEGDVVKLNTFQGKTTVVVHEREFDNLDSPIKGAYAGVVTDDGEDLGAEVMTIADIEKSWSMSPIYNPEKPNPNGTHAKFDKEMALRTVIRKRCKPIFNTSDDAELLASIKGNAVDGASAEMDAEVAEYANLEIVDVDTKELPEPIPVAEVVASQQAAEPAEVPAQEAKPF